MSKARRTWLLAAVAVALVAAGCGAFLLRGQGEEGRGGGPSGPGQGRPVAVVTAPAEATRIVRTIESVGNVEASQSVVITAEAPARVSAILFEEGQVVESGVPLVRLRADQERADVAALQAEAAELRGRLGRLEGLAREGAVARGRVVDLRRQLAAAEARIASARSQLAETVIRAPFTGRVGLRELSLGALVQPGTELVTLDGTAEVDLRFNIGERDLGRVQVGSKVEVTTPAYPDRRFEGAVASLDSRLNTAQRSLQAKARLPNADGLLRPGMLGHVEIAVETVEDAITVPPMAVQVRGNTQFVYRIVQGCAQRVEVVAGQRQPERLEILEGLRPGDRVAVEGLQFLSTATPVVEKKPHRPGGGEAGKPGGKEAGEGDGPQGGGDASNDKASGGEEGAGGDAAARCDRLLEQAGTEGQGKDTAKGPG